LWDNIQELLNFDGNQIMTNNCYPDSIFPKVIEALVMLRQEGDNDFYMEFFGKKFVKFFSTYGFEKILRVAGRSFRDFLHSIDQLHDSNRFTFPNMKSPLFFVELEDPCGAFLHYQ
jgi:guanylate cyclase